MINRREFIGITAGAGASLAFTSDLLGALAQPGGKLIQRAIPSSGEMLPVISFAPRSLGGAAMSSQPADVAAIKAVLKASIQICERFRYEPSAAEARPKAKSGPCAGPGHGNFGELSRRGGSRTTHRPPP